MTEKLMASELFKDKKISYSQTINKPFKIDRLTDLEEFSKIKKPEFINQKLSNANGDESLLVRSIHFWFLVFKI